MASRTQLTAAGFTPLQTTHEDAARAHRIAAALVGLAPGVAAVNYAASLDSPKQAAAPVPIEARVQGAQTEKPR
jgi:hypothetical protein